MGDWGPRLHKNEKANWAPAFTSLCFLTENSLLAAASSACYHASSTTMDSTWRSVQVHLSTRAWWPSYPCSQPLGRKDTLVCTWIASRHISARNSQVCLLLFFGTSDSILIAQPTWSRLILETISVDIKSSLVTRWDPVSGSNLLLPSPASLKLPLGTRRFCPSRLHVLLKDLLIGTLYSRSSFSHQAAALLGVYTCSGSISQGCLFLRESSEVSPAFRSGNLPKSTAKKLKIDEVLIHQQPLWELH